MPISFLKFSSQLYLRQAFTRDWHLLISQVLQVDAFATPNLIMVSPQVSHMFQGRSTHSGFGASDNNIHA